MGKGPSYDPYAAADAQDKIRIGYAISKTGPYAGGASITTLPNYQLWVKDVNAAGGIKLGDKRLPVEVVEYDDRSSSEEAVKAIERLANQDKVDFIFAPWGTGLNLAVGPTLNRLGYPHLAVTSVTDKAPELAKRWANATFWLGTSAQISEALAELLGKLKSEGKIGGTIAMVSVADQFGIELSAAGREAFKKAGFTLAYDKTYPLGSQDIQPLLKDAMATNPDAFIAFSYPPDTIALTEQAQLLTTLGREPERIPDDALDAAAGEHVGLDRDLARQVAMDATAHPRVLTLGVLAHAHHVDVLRTLAPQRPLDSRHQANGPQVYV